MIELTEVEAADAGRGRASSSSFPDSPFQLFQPYRAGRRPAGRPSPSWWTASTTA